MFFYLMTLKIGYVLEQDAPAEVEGETVAQMRERQKWEQDHFMCKGHILNAMSNSLYDVYEPTSTNKTARELWTELENKYKTEDARNKRFLVSKLYDFRMVDTQSILVQIHDFQVLLHQIIFKGHTLDEAFQVSSIIAKLPPTWKNTRKELTQKKEPLDLQELIKFLQIEENTRNMEKIEVDKKTPQRLWWLKINLGLMERNENMMEITIPVMARNPKLSKEIVGVTVNLVISRKIAKRNRSKNDSNICKPTL